MKISHETPMCLLEDSQRFNDYDYCLPHLLDEEPKYLEYFQKSKKEGRYIIMDNSLHELGEAYSHERLIHWVNELKPNEFIVPDVWEDAEQSIHNAAIWQIYDFPTGVEKVAVVQATTLNEAAECVKRYKDLGYPKIAFSYGASYYNDICTHPNKDLGKALGRLFVVSTLLKTGELKQDDRVHLLGCAVPQEFGWYKGINCIESIDTSNPVMATLEDVSYTNQGLISKPKANMNDYFYMLDNQIDYDLLEYNVNKFRKINNI
ncbi:MAG: hypothetical protein CMD25_06660 [Flavobacteriales bacterium]|nr:hypothetical protein [Flavobacteriales bacterium]|tara:strand:+ start:72 stop:857 length:786 start_codon:yes stop_codon:yes gene_type:complete